MRHLVAAPESIFPQRVWNSWARAIRFREIPHLATSIKAWQASCPRRAMPRDDRRRLSFATFGALLGAASDATFAAQRSGPSTVWRGHAQQDSQTCGEGTSIRSRAAGTAPRWRRQYRCQSRSRFHDQHVRLAEDRKYRQRGAHPGDGAHTFMRCRLEAYSVAIAGKFPYRSNEFMRRIF